jgi:hypothetical protein
MKNLILLGKKYKDQIIFVESNRLGETNVCSSISNQDGGMYNFDEVNFEDEWRIQYMSRGVKRAYIVVNKGPSRRTSYVHDLEEAKHEQGFFNHIHGSADWVHVCYLDDYEPYLELENLNVPFSVDFCTTNNREPFLKIMKKAEIIFDSRERKNLYNGISMDTKLILHDECGIEIIQNGEIVATIDNNPISGLSVNGAGDLFAGNFIKHYGSSGATIASLNAMKETKNLLLKRK